MEHIKEQLPKQDTGAHKESEAPFSTSFLSSIKDKVPAYMMPLFLSVLASCSNDSSDEKVEKVPYDFSNSTSDVSFPKYRASATKEQPHGFVDLLLSETSVTDRNYKEFEKDPSLSIVRSLGYDTVVPEILAKLPDVEKAEWVMRTARTMSVTFAEVTEENFNETLKEIMEAASNKEIVETKLFAGRNVAIFANNETMKKEKVTKLDENLYSVKRLNEDDDLSKKVGDNSRFANKEVQKGIASDHPKELKVFRPERKIEDIPKNTEEFLEYIKTHDNLTLVFSGHGSLFDQIVSASEQFTDLPPGALTKDNMLTGEYLENEYRSELRPEILAAALIERYKKGLRDTPILIFQSCYNQNFARALYLHLMAEGGPVPIIIGTSEFGQYGFTDGDLPSRSSFWDNLLFKKGSATPTTIGDVMELEMEHGKTGMQSNISIFIPHRSSPESRETYMQIAETEDEKTQKDFETMYAASLNNNELNKQNIHLFEAAQPEKAAQIKKTLEDDATHA